MRILLLGHPDIASVYAMDRVIRLLPTLQFTVCLSPSPNAPTEMHPALLELAQADQILLQQFISGAFDGCLPASAILQSMELPTPNSAAGLNLVRAVEPELIISIRYRRILKEDCIAIPAKGVLNLHSGLLPDYKGVMATFWAMLADEEEFGSTLHRIIDSGIDTGPIISRQSHVRDAASSYLSNVLSLYQSGTDAIVAAVHDIRNLRKVQLRLPQDGGGYFSEPGPEAVDDFLRAGCRLTDGSEETLIRTLVQESL